MVLRRLRRLPARARKTQPLASVAASEILAIESASWLKVHGTAKMKEPATTTEFAAHLPPMLFEFVTSLVGTFDAPRADASAAKRKQRNATPEAMATAATDRTATVSLRASFVVAVVLRSGLGIHTWLHQALETLFSKPYLHERLHELLWRLGIVATSLRHTRRLAAKEAAISAPEELLLAAIESVTLIGIDNIDRLSKNIRYGHIFDAVRATANLTIRVAFQWQLEYAYVNFVNFKHNVFSYLALPRDLTTWVWGWAGRGSHLGLR